MPEGAREVTEEAKPVRPPVPGARAVLTFVLGFIGLVGAVVFRFALWQSRTDEAWRLYDQVVTHAENANLLDARKLLPRLERLLRYIPEIEPRLALLNAEMEVELSGRAAPELASTYLARAHAQFKRAEAKEAPASRRIAMLDQWGRVLQDLGRASESREKLESALELRRRRVALLARWTLRLRSEQATKNMPLTLVELASIWTKHCDTNSDEQSASKGLLKGLQQSSFTSADRDLLLSFLRNWTLGRAESDEPTTEPESEDTPSKPDPNRLPSAAPLSPKEIVAKSIAEGQAPVLPVELESTQAWADTLSVLESPEEAVLDLENELRKEIDAYGSIALQLARLERSSKTPNLERAAWLTQVSLESTPVGSESEIAVRCSLAEVHLQIGNPFSAHRALAYRIPNDAKLRARQEFLIGKALHEEAHEIQDGDPFDWSRLGRIGAFVQLPLDHVLEGLHSRFDILSAAIGHRPNLATLLPSDGPLRSIFARVFYLSAIKRFATITDDRFLEDETLLGQSLLLKGRCQGLVGDSARARRSLERLIDGFPNTDIEHDARFYIADVLRVAGDAKWQESLELAAKFQKERPLSGISRSNLDRIFESAWSQRRRDQRYGDAIRVAETYIPFGAPGRGRFLLAESAREAADRLVPTVAIAGAKPSPAGVNAKATPNQGVTIGATVSLHVPVTDPEARRLYRQAGENYQFSADEGLVASTNFIEQLWLAGECFYRGHDYQRCCDSFKQYLSTRFDQGQDLLATLYMSQAYMALGRWQDALDQLEVGLGRGSSSPFRFEARIRLAENILEIARADFLSDQKPFLAPNDLTKKLEYAHQLVASNIDDVGGELEPGAREFRESLILLGRLANQLGRNDEAIQRFREALARYPKYEHTPEVVFHLADSFLRSSDAMESAWNAMPNTPNKESTAEETRREIAHRRREAIRRLEQFLAMTMVRDLRDESPARAALRREAVVVVGDLHAKLNDWVASIDSYRRALQDWQDRPECIHLFLKLAWAHSRAGDSSTALAVLRQAEWAIQKLPDEAFHKLATNKREWAQRLALMTAEL